jgi:hypothetical protein
MPVGIGAAFSEGVALQIPEALAFAQDPISTATSSRKQAGMRTPRRMRAPGIALRKLIRSRSMAAETLWGTERRQSHRLQPMLAAMATTPVKHLESALAPDPLAGVARAASTPPQAGPQDVWDKSWPLRAAVFRYDRWAVALWATNS